MLRCTSACCFSCSWRGTQVLLVLGPFTACTRYAHRLSGLPRVDYKLSYHRVFCRASEPKTKVFASACPPPPSGTPRRPGSPVSSAGKDRGGGGGGDGGGAEAEDAARTAAMAADNVILEVAAYPAGLFSPPETGGHGYQQRRLLSGGRRRVVLTAESLWKRRRLMHPKEFLSERSPLELSGWLGREKRIGNVSTPSGAEAPGPGAEAPGLTGSAEGVAEAGVRNVGPGRGPGAEGSAGDRSEVGHVGEGGVGRKAQEKAFNDLVNMVAFGPVGDGEDRSGGARMHAWACVCVFMSDFGEMARRPSATKLVPEHEKEAHTHNCYVRAVCLAFPHIQKQNHPPYVPALMFRHRKDAVVGGFLFYDLTLVQVSSPPQSVLLARPLFDRLAAPPPALSKFRP